LLHDVVPGGPLDEPWRLRGLWRRPWRTDLGRNDGRRIDHLDVRRRRWRWLGVVNWALERLCPLREGPGPAPARPGPSAPGGRRGRGVWSRWVGGGGGGVGGTVSTALTSVFAGLRTVCACGSTPGSTSTRTGAGSAPPTFSCGAPGNP